MIKSLMLAPLACATLLAPATAQTEFVNWESPHVHPLELSADGTQLFAVNTPDNRLEVFDAREAGITPLVSIPVGLDPVSVRARSSHEIWVVNHVSDSISVVDLETLNVTATIATDDEPCDVVFAGTPRMAYVSCQQANNVMVFDPRDLSKAPLRIPIDGQRPRALATSSDGSRVYVAVFESGNATTVLGGGIDETQPGTLGFPPNVVDEPSGPWGGVNPPPNSGTVFEPPLAPGLPTPPGTSLIVRRDAAGKWFDDNGGDWTDLVSGANAGLSGRPVGWDLGDKDLATIDTGTFAVSYERGLMNVCMTLAVHPISGDVSVFGTEATNEVRFEPNITGTFTRVLMARVQSMQALVKGVSAVSLADLNPHLDYSVPTIAQRLRDQSLGDPRGAVWADLGGRCYVTGMGSNNVVVLDATGARVGKRPTIEVGEGPTGIAYDGDRHRLYVLNRFEGSLSLVSTVSESETARVPFFDPEPAAIKAGRVHLYGTHENSGLGQISCASCHVDARFDRLAWDLGDPSGAMKGLAGQNKGMGLPGLTGGFAPHHPMKGAMTTQTLQDIIGKEPLHWRGDRDGLEEFNGAFVGLQGDDEMLDPVEMQEFEDFLSTLTFPPNPFREFDNSLPTDLPLPGHFSSGRFTPAGTPLPNGDAQRGIALFRPPNFLDASALACVTCHTTQTGMGAARSVNGANFKKLPVGPNGESFHALVSVDGSKQKAIKIPQLRSLYKKVGFDTTQLVNQAGFGLLHDGSVDSIARFVEEPAFDLKSVQDTADLVALMLAFSGSDLPKGSVKVVNLEPTGPTSQDTHAAVGRQATLDGAADPTTSALLASMLGLADLDVVGVVVKGLVAGESRGFVYDSATGQFQSDRAAEVLAPGALEALAGVGSELTYTVVPEVSELRIGIDRDADGVFDRDELDAGTDPADPTSFPGAAPVSAPAQPTNLVATPYGVGRINLRWEDASTNELGFALERAPAGSGDFELVATLAAGSTAWPDTGLAAGLYDYRLRAYNRGGVSGFAAAMNAATFGGGAAAKSLPGAFPVAPTLRRPGAGH